MLKKEIKLSPDNRDAVEAALREVNGRASAHAVTSMHVVTAIAERATALLDRRDVRIADRAGATVEYKPAGPSANRYKFSAASTRVTLRLAADGKTWRLAAVAYDQVHPKSGELFAMRLTPERHARYLDARARDFGIVQVPAPAPLAEAA